MHDLQEDGEKAYRKKYSKPKSTSLHHLHLLSLLYIAMKTKIKELLKKSGGGGGGGGGRWWKHCINLKLTTFC